MLKSPVHKLLSLMMTNMMGCLKYLRAIGMNRKTPIFLSTSLSWLSRSHKGTFGSCWSLLKSYRCKVWGSYSSVHFSKLIERISWNNLSKVLVGPGPSTRHRVGPYWAWQNVNVLPRQSKYNTQVLNRYLTMSLFDTFALESCLMRGRILWFLLLLCIAPLKYSWRGIWMGFKRLF